MIKKLLLSTILFFTALTCHADTHTISNTGGNWNATGTWTSGVVPGNGDDVVATATSGNLVVNVNTNTLKSFDLNGYTGTLSGSSNITVQPATGNTVTCRFAGTVTWSGILLLNATGTAVINFYSGGNTLGRIDCNSGSQTGTVNQRDALTTTDTSTGLHLGGGTYNTNGFDITAKKIDWSHTSTVNITNSTITINGTGSCFDLTTKDRLTFTSTSSTIIFSDTSSTRKYLNFQDQNCNILTISGDNAYLYLWGQSIATLNVNTAGLTNGFILSSYTRLPLVITSSFTTNGSAGNLAKMYAETAGTISRIKKSSGTISVDYMDLQGISAGGGATWLAGTHSTNSGYNRGWTFNSSAYSISDWGRKCKLTQNKAYVTASINNFPVLVGYNCVGTEYNLPDEMLTTGNSNASLSDGGDIRFSTDSAGSSLIPFEIVTYTQNATQANRKAQIFLKMNVSSAADTDIYVWYKRTNVCIPAEDETIGQFNVWDSNFVCVMHLEESAAYYLDSTSYAGSGSYGYNADPTQGTGKLRYGQNYSAPADISIGNTGVNPFAITGNVTVECWEKTNTTSNQGIFQAFDPSNNYDGFGLGIGIGVAGYLTWEYPSGGWAYSTSTTYANNAWHHVAAVVDTNTLRFYNNGAADGTTDITGVTPNGFDGTTLLGTFLIGADSTTYNFDGVLDELRVSKTNRSADWLHTQYHNMSAPNTFWTVGTPEDVGGAGAYTGWVTVITN